MTATQVSRHLLPISTLRRSTAERFGRPRMCKASRTGKRFRATEKVEHGGAIITAATRPVDMCRIIVLTFCFEVRS
eukprot:2752316-Pyramimonas_sp.AAC.1